MHNEIIIIVELINSAANICEEENRVKITGDDVIQALKDLELQDWVEKIQKFKK